MHIELSCTVDDWGQASLAGTITASEPCHALTFATFKSDIWWAKSSLATIDIAYTAFYHHVRDDHKRQVLVTCGSSSIDKCIISRGYDPIHSCIAEITPLVPSTVYSCREHDLGIILIPKSATSSMRNKIWRIKESVITKELAPFKNALAHGRRGHSER